MSFSSRLALALLVFAQLGCQKKAAGPPPRYAVVRFENLSADPSLDWVGRAASEALPFMLAGAMNGPVLNPQSLERFAPALGSRPMRAPGLSSEKDRAILAGATRLVAGYVEQANGKLRVVAEVEDLRSGRTLSIVEGDGGNGLSALAAVAGRLAEKGAPKAYLTSSPEALRLYALALEGSAGDGLREMQQAVETDPRFGPAWVALTRFDARRHDPGAAEQTIDRAARQALDPMTVASLDFERATLANDNPARIAAMRKIAVLSPGDSATLQSLAENEMSAGQFRAAGSDWRRIISTQPDNAAALNDLAYCLAYSGDPAGAAAAIEQYRRQWPKEANPIDSAGDIQYLFRKFPNAAALYLEANSKDPDFLRNGELYKAAWAKFEAGDKAGADEAFARYKTARVKAKDPAMPIVEGDWLYRTGRTAQAIEVVRRTIQEASPAVRADAAGQLTIWDLVQGERARAQQDAAGTAAAAAPSAIIARFAALPSASSAEWTARANKLFAAPGFAQLRRLALGYALILDRKRTDALPVWKEIADGAPATEFFLRDVYARLQGKPVAQPLIPQPGTVNEFAALLDSL